MRRKDRQMSREFGYDVIDRADYGVLSVVDEEDGPYAIPLSIVRKQDILYFHSAKEGRKCSIFEEGSSVWVTFVGERKIPENYTNDELDEISKDPSKVVLLLSSVFTTEYESAMVKGRVKLVDNETEKIKALELICQKYTPTKARYVDAAIKSGMGRTNVYKVSIDEITAKRKKYDDKGKEMKWGIEKKAKLR